MAEAQRGNPAFYALIIFGALATLGGIATWALSAQALESKQRVAEYATALSGYELGGDAVAAAQLGVWIGVGVLILGVLMLLAALIIRAAQPHARVDTA